MTKKETAQRFIDDHAHTFTDAAAADEAKRLADERIAEVLKADESPYFPPAAPTLPKSKD